MGVTRLWAGAELRRRWRLHVVLALLIGFVGAAVLTCVAAARRTDSAHSRYLATQGIPQLETSLDPSVTSRPAFFEKLRAIPGVKRVSTYSALYAAVDSPDVVPGQDMLVFAPADDAYANTVDRPIVTHGRLPRADAVDEVFANERAAKSLDLHVGSRRRLSSIGIDEAPALERGDFEAIKGDGPKPTVRVVGIGRTRLDLYDLSYAQQYFIASRAFGDRYGPTMAAFGPLVDLRLDNDASTAKVRTAVKKQIAGPAESIDVNVLNEPAKGLTDAARVQAIALLLVALTALAAGAVTVSQAIGRSVSASAADYEVLGALGVDARRRAGLGAALFLPAAAGGAALAVAGAWVASRFFPTGAVRDVEVHPGVQFDVRVLLLGGLLVVALVLARAAFGAWRQRVGAAHPQRVRRAGLVERATTALSPSTATGVRWAVGRRDGTRAHPRAALLGVVIGVAGLLAVVTYTSAIDDVVSNPNAYGWSFDADAGGGTDPREVAGIHDGALKEKVIGDVAVATIASRVAVDGKLVQGWSYKEVRGHIGPSVVKGRAPARDDEVLLGTKTADALDVGIGDAVQVRQAKGGERSLRVVGLGLFSTLDSNAFTTGMVTTPSTLASLRLDEPIKTVVIRFVPGTDVKAADAAFRKEGVYLTYAQPTADINNLRVVRNYPRWLALFLVVLALLATVNAFVLSTRRRRHESGVLRAMGFSRRQLSHAVSTQGVTVGLLAVVIGVPVGLLLGRWIWTTHADSIGIGDAVDVPAAIAVVVALVTVFLTWLIATAAGRFTTRTALIESLRVE